MVKDASRHAPSFFRCRETLVSTIEIKLDVLISSRGLTPEDLPQLFARMWMPRTLTTRQVFLLGSERPHWKAIWRILDYILYLGHRSKNRLNWKFIDPPVPPVVPSSRSIHCLHPYAVEGVISVSTISPSTSPPSTSLPTPPLFPDRY